MTNPWEEVNVGKSSFAEGFRGEGKRPVFADPMNKYHGGTLSRNPNWRPTVDDPIPRGKCEYIKRDGTRCTVTAVAGTGNDPTDKLMCRFHGGSLPNVKAKAERVRAAAADSLLDMVSDAVEFMGQTVKNTAAPDAVRLAAAKEILDRTGIKQADQLEITVENRKSPAEALAEQIAKLRQVDPAPEILEEAEIEDEDSTDAQSDQVP